MEHPDGGVKVQGRYVAHADLGVSPMFKINFLTGRIN